MKKFLPIIVLVSVLSVTASLLWFRPSPKPVPRISGQLVVHVLDVGQGDCILIQTPDRRNILVDGGPPDSADRVIDYLTLNGVNRIDLLVITHPHNDHIGGLPKVLQEFGVSDVLDSAYPHGSRTYRDILAVVEERKIGYREAAVVDQLHVGKDVRLDVFWPVEDHKATGINNSSVVLRMSYRDISMLLAGDIQTDAEGRLLAHRQDLQSTILKVAHHGSKDSTSNEFLQVVKPSFAVISVGAGNPYGHPSSGTLRRLNSARAKVYRTDEHGTVVFTTDGRKIQVMLQK